jgi:hypothetical protein
MVPGSFGIISEDAAHATMTSSHQVSRYESKTCSHVEHMHVVQLEITGPSVAA